MNHLLSTLTGVVILASSFSAFSNDNVNTQQSFSLASTTQGKEVVGAAHSLETTKVEMGVNLHHGRYTTLLDTHAFDPNNPVTYTSSTSNSVCEPQGAQQLLIVYFLHAEANKWDVYFSLDEEPLNVLHGSEGGNGQAKATIEFAGDGSFIRQVPYIINSVELTSSGKTYQIEFDFYSNKTTSLDEHFMVYKFDVNGC